SSKSWTSRSRLSSTSSTIRTRFIASLFPLQAASLERMRWYRLNRDILQGECYSEGRADPYSALHRDFPTQEVGQMPAYGQSQPRAPKLPSRVVIDLTKGLKDPLASLLGDANTGIRHSHGQHLSLVSGRHSDCPYLRELHCIAQQMHEQSFQLVLIGIQHRQVRVK